LRARRSWQELFSVNRSSAVRNDREIAVTQPAFEPLVPMTRNGCGFAVLPLWHDRGARFGSVVQRRVTVRAPRDKLTKRDVPARQPLFAELTFRAHAR
jgi:hypothetical protein